VSEQLFGKIVTFTIAVVAAVVLSRNAWGKRRWILGYVIRFLLLFVGAPAISSFLIHVVGLHGWWVFYVAVAVAFASPLYPLRRNRSRWIPATTRRKVIEKWERETGNTFDAKIYELDHKIPFAKGGGHTLDNLRVVKRNVNRKKGQQEPGLGDWLAIWRGKDE
jgi:hypothetical protein